MSSYDCLHVLKKCEVLWLISNDIMVSVNN